MTESDNLFPKEDKAVEIQDILDDTSRLPAMNKENEIANSQQDSNIQEQKIVQQENQENLQSRESQHDAQSQDKPGDNTQKRFKFSALTNDSSLGFTSSDQVKADIVSARLKLTTIHPLSVFRLSLVIGFLLFVVWMFYVSLLYLVLSIMGVWNKIGSSLASFNTSTEVTSFLGPGVVLGAAAGIGVICYVAFVALNTLTAYIYNVSSGWMGGIEVTLTDTTEEN